MTVSAFISVISAVLAIVRALVSFAQQRQWLDAGTAEAVLKSLEDSDNAIARAQTVRNSVRVSNQRDPASVLRDDDGFKRPGD